jgi:biotin transport system permease protein
MKSLYSDTPTWLHRVPASLKLLSLLVLSLTLFGMQGLDALVALSVLSAGMFASLGHVARRVKPLLTGLAVACGLLIAFHAWMGQVHVGSVTVLRLLSATLLGLALTLTTRPSDLLEVFEKVLAPLRIVGISPERLSLRLALMLRFVEHFFALWQKLDDAHRLRTGKAGGFKILAPLTLQMLMAARRVADALFVRLHQ